MRSLSANAAKPLQAGPRLRITGIPRGSVRLVGGTITPMPAADPMVLRDLPTYGPDRCDAVDYPEAAAYTRRLAETQYENFTVVSRLLPSGLRDDFRHVYAFCRAADDLGDEVGDPHRARELLDWWRRELDACFAGEPRHPIYVALHRTIEKHRLPRKPFDDLIDAFVQDQSVTRYDAWDGVLDYCTRSADPVGRLVLRMFGHGDGAGDDERFALSDQTCSALQLANFWQDVRRDVLERDRVYLPRDVAASHGLDVEAMAGAIRAHDADPAAGRPRLDAVRPAFVATMRELVERTWPMFERGHALWPRLDDPRLRASVKLFSRGGETVLRKIERRGPGGYDTLTGRPAVTKADKLRLVMTAAAGRLLGL